MSEPTEIEKVQSVVVRVAHYLDGKRSSDLRSLYADDVETDYTSLFGGAPQRSRGDDLIDGWRKLLGPVATQHLFGPIEVSVSGVVARAERHVRASYYVKGAPGARIGSSSGTTSSSSPVAARPGASRK